MRQLFKSLVIASMSIAALASCNKESVNQNPEIADNIRVVEFTTTSPATRTVFGKPDGTTVPTLWTSNHTVAVSLNLNKSFKQSSTPEVSEDGTTATFNAETEDSETGPYTFYAISPYAALAGTTLTARKGILITVPTDQTPLENSVDEAAQILVAKTEAFSEFPANAVNFAFKHFTAYGKLSFSNLILAPEEAVVSVSLTAEENWGGRFYYYFESDSYEANPASKTITLKTNETKDIWFACAPVDLGGKSVDIVITTDKGTTYSRTITIPAGKTFESGKINSFTVNMSGIKSDDTVEYELVTDASMLSVGSQIIIAASASNFAISTTQNGNNRGTAAITKTENKITNPGADVQILTLEDGTEAGTFAFNTGNGYLYAVSGGNYLRTKANLDNTASWQVTIANGVATIKSIGTSDDRYLKYNSSSKIFSCYNSGQLDVSIYAIPDERQNVTLTFDQDSFDLEANSEEYERFEPQVATIYPSVLSSEIEYSIDDENGVTINFDKATGDFKLTGTAGTATITATFAGNEAYRPASVSYTVLVFTAGGEEETETITFSEYYSDITGTGTKTIDGELISGTNFSIVFAKRVGGTATQYYANGTAVRWYGGGGLTISSVGNRTITKIVINYTQTANSISSNVGSYELSNRVGTWTGNSSEIVFSQSGTSGHNRISSITITTI